ncbi:hypothetical protein L2E82_03402 [Cichorium intybus]|uniref:Uncharacterized protein n=1 Tax=Cichorium intybus TaxID=13427 RepID=A0ACB9H4Z7_CICIN|nr:hypothetical protein L2E82_03402 [Cichorium intybus]
MIIEKLDTMWPNLKTKEVTSRYKSPTPRRCPSPNTTRTVTTPPISTFNRAISAERRRPGTPKLPSYPSTPVHDTIINIEQVTRKAFPSPMRSLSVSFQSDTFSMPTSKREKPPPQALSDRTLKSSSNVSQKPSRKPTPERKRSPLKGKNVIDQSENSKPMEGLHSKLVDQHRWPSRTSSNFKASKPLEKSTSDPARVLSSFANKGRLEHDNLRRMSNLVSSRSQSFPGATLNKPLVLGSKSESPSRRPASPSRRPASPLRSCSPLRQSCDSNKVSVLTFIADIKKGKRVVDQIEDAHYLRLLHNRQIQWRFVNASTEASLKSQKVTAKKSLFNVWRSTSKLRNSVAEKRMELDQLRLKLKLHSVLNQQMAYLDEWGLIEREHNLALSGANEDLQSSTLRVPITGGAMVDIETMKSSLCSAIQVMQTIGSSIQSTLARMEGPSCVASELATVMAQERGLLDECEGLLVSAASLQAKEYSLRTHLLQLKQDSTPP